MKPGDKVVITNNFYNIPGALGREVYVKEVCDHGLMLTTDETLTLRDHTLEEGDDKWCLFYGKRDYVAYELKLGKRYVRRDGSITPPLQRGLADFLIDPETLMHYDPKDREWGWMVRPMSKTEHDHDLVAEYEGEEE